jgi:hypothetical protein
MKDKLPNPGEKPRGEPVAGSLKSTLDPAPNAHDEHPAVASPLESALSPSLSHSELSAAAWKRNPFRGNL